MTRLDQIQALHSKFNELIPESKCILNMMRERDWWDWLKWRAHEPFTEADLELVVEYNRKLIAQKHQFPACMKFSYVVGKPNLFEEDLSMARAQLPKRTNRDEVLEATGRPSRPETPEKLAGPLAQAALDRLREAAR